jgi:hypothetical protein
LSILISDPISEIFYVNAKKILCSAIYFSLQSEKQGREKWDKDILLTG